MNILVIGGAGYIGSHCVYKIIETRKNDKVIVVDNLKTGHIEAVHKDAKFYQGDITDTVFLDRVFKENKIDIVVHFAAKSLVGESMVEPLAYFRNNVYGMQVLLEVMKENDVKKIVFSSSAATYGEPGVDLIDETTPTNPTNPYGESKLMMEKMMKWCDVSYGFKYVSLRYFNVAGAHKSGDIGEVHRPETHLIPIVLKVPLKQLEQVSIYGDDYPTKDGTCIRDYIHIEDLIDAHLKAIDYLINGGKSDVFNLGTSYGYSVKEIIDAAREVTNNPIKTVITPRRPGDPAKLVASSAKAVKILKWKINHEDVKDSISSAWKFHQKHPNGF
jgi:UDP-glucose 4-epimerase